jgi:asparagine synthase (glutamine-hydrolysing)
MCGITAVLSRRAAIDPKIMQAGTAALHHCGHDGRADWISTDGRAALCHTRLSIIDLATGDQPISNEGDTIHIVVNGEFYDFERIRARLESQGDRFRTRSTVRSRSIMSCLDSQQLLSVATVGPFSIGLAIASRRS